MSERDENTILFVCTGNTCRSPMAAALAIDRFLREPHKGAGIRVLSAGISAGEGLPATPEAVEAVRRLGASMPAHRSTMLTRELIDQAGAIYCMTADHARMVLQAAPDAADRVFLLDPDGQDIPDPLGGPPHLYDETAQRIRGLVERRLQELVA